MKKEKLAFAWSKVANALKWMVASGVATFGLSELLRVATEVEIDRNLLLVINAVINTLIFGIAKYNEGNDK